jgi:zinc protease
MANEAGKPFTTGGVGRNDIEGVARGATMQASFVTDPRRALEILVRARSQLLAFGLTQAEVDRAIGLRRMGMQRAVDSAATRSNGELVGGLQAYASSGYAPLAPAARLALFEAAARDFTAEEANQGLRERFGGAPSVLYFAGEPPEGGEAMLAAVMSAKEAPQTAYVPPTIKPWPYTDFGAPGRVVERREVKDLGVHFVRFDNGVRLTVKSTDFAKGQVEVSVRFGHGQLDLPRDRLTAADWSTSMLVNGGLKDFTFEEMLRSIQGKGVVALVFQNEDAFVIVNGPSGTPLGTPASALDLQLQLMAATVSRPGWRLDNWSNLMAASARSEASASISPGAVFGNQGRALLHGGDMRWVRSTYAMHATWKPEDAVAFMKPIVGTAPLEVIIVGDVAVDRAIEETAKTFGALPARADQPEPAGLRDVKFPAPTAAPVVLRHKGRADQAMAHISWPATDLFADTRGYQAANVLAALIASRATERLRTASGKAYAPGARADFSGNLPGYGRIGASVDVAPGDIDAAYAALDAIAVELATTEVSADELARMLSPRIEAAKRELKTNGAWTGSLAGAQADPRKLDYLRNRLAELESLKPADIRAAARAWLVKDKSWRLTILPEPTAAAAESKTPAPASAGAGV